MRELAKQAFRDYGLVIRNTRTFSDSPDKKLIIDRTTPFTVQKQETLKWLNGLNVSETLKLSIVDYRKFAKNFPIGEAFPHIPDVILPFFPILLDTENHRFYSTIELFGLIDMVVHEQNEEAVKFLLPAFRLQRAFIKNESEQKQLIFNEIKLFVKKFSEMIQLCSIDPLSAHFLTLLRDFEMTNDPSTTLQL